MVDSVDCVVVGAGVVGLACAARLARGGREVLVLEQHRQIGTETSSRNSEVIHAGIYYPTDSLKARLCVPGKEALYRHCEEFHVPFRRCGKIIVATSAAQLDVLRAYQRSAVANGLEPLRWLTAAQVRQLEPEVHSVGGIFSPTTGIIDSHAYMESLVGAIESGGGVIAFETRLEAAVTNGDGSLRLVTDAMELEARVLINATGLSAPDVARRLPHGDVRLPRAHYAKGHYYTLSGRSPFTHLVYPIAEPGGLGVHVTIDLSDQAKFGPDVTWIDAPDYTFDDTRRETFAAAIRRYYPGLDATRLTPGYTGIRPKLGDAASGAGDFLILGPQVHGVPGVVHLLGIESPGLTASLAIADMVANCLDRVP
jgi:L-2-hydroxyglutarate oxidase LhgO